MLKVRVLASEVSSCLWRSRCCPRSTYVVPDETAYKLACLRPKKERSQHWYRQAVVHSLIPALNGQSWFQISTPSPSANSLPTQCRLPDKMLGTVPAIGKCPIQGEYQLYCPRYYSCYRNNIKHGFEHRWLWHPKTVIIGRSKEGGDWGGLKLQTHRPMYLSFVRTFSQTALGSSAFGFYNPMSLCHHFLNQC